MKKLFYKITKLLGIKFCYSCNKCIWWRKSTLRYIESPKDEYGMKAPACDKCIYLTQEYNL